MSALQIAMAAGETSGDLLAGAVIRQLSMRLPPDSRYFGIGGAQMRAAGFQARFPSEKLAVRGYVEAARHLPEILWLRRAFKRTFRAAPAFQRCISSVRRSGRGAARAFIKSNAQRI